MTYLPLIGVLSWEEFDGVRPLPLVAGVEVLRGVDDPKPTGICLYGGLPMLPAPDLMLEVRRTPLPRVPSSESFKDRFDPVLEGGLDPFLDPGPPGCVDCLRVKPAMVSGIPPWDAS